MSKRRKIAGLIAAVFAALSINADAAMLYDSIVKAGVGARALSMGSAHVAIADDSTAAFWNPAGLGYIEERQGAFMHTNRFGIGLKYDYVSGILPFRKKNALALSFTQEYFKDIPVTDETGAVLSMTSNYERAYTLSYGRQVNYRLGLGANLKWMWHKLHTAQASGWEMDLGLLFRLNDQWKLGLKLADVSPSTIAWNTGANDNVPWEAVGGFSYNSKGGDFIASLELGKIDRQDTDIRVGMEYKVNKLMAFRGGWNEGFTAGASLSYRNWDFDYAWLSRDLGDTNVVSATIYLDRIRSGIRRGWKRKDTDMERRQARAELRRLPERKEDYTQSSGKPMDVLAAYKEREAASKMLEIEGMVKDAEEALKPENQAAETHYRLANTFLMDGLYNKALEEYKSAIAADPVHVLAHFNLGAVYSKLQMTDKAIYEYNIVTQLDPENLNAHLNLGDLHLGRGDKVEAARHYNKIILTSPDSLNADVARDRLEKL